MAKIAIILGESGSGKSTSLRNLNPEETGIISVLGKIPPFKGSTKMYSREKGNFFQVIKYENIIKAMKFLGAKESIKNIILDDLFFSMSAENFERAQEKGFGKFLEMGAHFQNILQTAVNLPNDKYAFILLHPQDVVSDGVIVKKEIKLVGKFVKEGFAPEALCNVILYCMPKFDENGNAQYGFHTHAFIADGCRYMCKSPLGMFEEDFIPNDLQLVIDAMKEFE